MKGEPSPCRSPVRWIIAVCLLVCAPLQLLALGAEAPSPPVLGIGLLAAALQTALLWLAVSLLLGGRRRSRSLRLAALAWGAFVVPAIATFANTRAFGLLNELGLHSFAASIAAPINEDALRFAGTLGVLSLVASRGRLTVTDGAVYGFLVGAGFEAAENLAFVLAASDGPEALQTALVRTGLGFGLHALWTALTGMVLAYCSSRAQAGLPARWGLLIPGLALPMLLHALWDAPSLSVAPVATFVVLAAVYAVSLALCTAGAVWARRHPRPVHRGTR